MNCVGRGWKGQPARRDLARQPRRAIPDLSHARRAWNLTDEDPTGHSRIQWENAPRGVVTMAWGLLTEMLFHGLSQRGCDRLLNMLRRAPGVLSDELLPWMPSSATDVLSIVTRFVSNIVLSFVSFFLLHKSGFPIRETSSAGRRSARSTAELYVLPRHSVISPAPGSPPNVLRCTEHILRNAGSPTGMESFAVS